MMHKRTLLALAGGVAATAAGTALNLLRKPLPQTSGLLRMAGVGGRIEVLTDGRGVPHIYAMDEADLFWAQGFTMARERLFQMDFLRRFAAGRLSELAGEPTIQIDRWMRLFGLRRSAEKGWPHASGEARVALLSFSAGVNAAIEQMLAHKTLPIEFGLLGMKPEGWTPVDSLSIIRVIALSLSVGWESDLMREALVTLLGEEASWEALPIIPRGSPIINSPGLAQVRTIASGVGAGSNCWVVDGSRTESGLPLLAADPHLALQLPPIWFVQHLDCPTLKVAGCALVGVPGIVLGHNEHGAWGITSGYADVQDLYVEERVETEDGTLAFRWGDMVLPATILEERITVKGRVEPVAQRVVLTRHGPLISDLLPNEPRDLALRWTIDEPDDIIGAVLGTNRATTWGEFRAALADLGSPPLSLAWAGRDGSIGWILAGRVPIRQGENGQLPLDGSTGDNEWLGYVPLDELPQLANPPAGYIVHANNRPVGDDYPHWLGTDFLPGYRAARIAELVEGRATHSAETFRAMQADLYSLPEHRLAQLVGSLPALSGAMREAQRHLREWDGQMRVESVGAAIAHTLFHQVRHQLVSDTLAQWTARWEGKTSQPDLQNVLPHALQTWAWVLERLEEPNHPWWDARGTPRREGRDEVLILALETTVRQLRREHGDNPRKWMWGRLHQRAVAHPFGALPGIGRLFNRGPFPFPGSAFSLNPDLNTVQSYQPGPVVGASVRYVADVSDWDHFLLSLPGGNSGHPASPHYADGLKMWRGGDLEPLPWSRAAVERAAEGRRLLLVPD
jgi:penicillin amidase